jgi:PmbA protein
MTILTQLQVQAEQAEVFAIQSVSTKVVFEANRLKSSQVEETTGTAVRVVKGGRLGFAASANAAADDRLIKNALESAALGHSSSIRFAPPQSAPGVKTFDDAIAGLSITRLADIGREIIDLIHTVEAEAQVAVTVQRTIEQFDLTNTSGSGISCRRSPLSITASVMRIKGDDVLFVYDGSGGVVWQDDYLAGARRINDRLQLAKNDATMKSARLPVILAPAGVLVLALALQAGLNGKNVYAGSSPMAGRIGEKLFDDKISIVDDGTLDGQFGSAHYDHEGVARRRTMLIEHGILRSFFYDLRTAAQAGVESTANGSRSLFAPPAPAPANLLLESGQTPLSAMIGGIREGLLVADVLGLGEGNVISGAFSTPLALGYKIEQGEVVGRVKDMSIAGNIYDTLKSVAAVSQESEWINSEWLGCNFRLPYVLLPEMNVVAKG